MIFLFFLTRRFIKVQLVCKFWVLILLIFIVAVHRLLTSTLYYNKFKNTGHGKESQNVDVEHSLLLKKKTTKKHVCTIIWTLLAQIDNDNCHVGETNRLKAKWTISNLSFSFTIIATLLLWCIFLCFCVLVLNCNTNRWAPKSNDGKLDKTVLNIFAHQLERPDSSLKSCSYVRLIQRI